MYPKYECFGCGRVWRSGETIAICSICRGRGVRLREIVDIDIPKWDKVIEKAERFIEKSKGI